jgi:hypothetical protein
VFDVLIAGGDVYDGTGAGAVCPGFINILSHSHLTILHDPRSLGELTQGVTTKVFGEGTSMGPLTPRLKVELEWRGRGLDAGVSWTRLSEYLRHVERRGASQNVASFIGAGTLRAGAVGYGDRPKGGPALPGPVHAGSRRLACHHAAGRRCRDRPPGHMTFGRLPGYMYSRRRIQARVNQPQIGGR